MKYKITFLILFYTLTQFAQSKSEFHSKAIDVFADEHINTELLDIKFSTGTWNVTIYPIFRNNEILENMLPTEIGIYNFVIQYSDTLFYSETVVYKLKPKFEKLEFNFYQEGTRIFCRIKSDYVQELNKEIVLNEYGEDLKAIINNLKEK